MFSFNKSAKKKLSPANFQLNLGKSPPQNKKPKSISPQKLYEYRKINTIPTPFTERSYSISISPPKSRDTNKPFTSHDLRQSINEYYKQKPPNNPPKLNLIKKLGTFTNNLKNTLFTKNKPVFLNLGQSPPRNNKQTLVPLKNIRNSIGGKKPTKKYTKKLN